MAELMKAQVTGMAVLPWPAAVPSRRQILLLNVECVRDAHRGPDHRERLLQPLRETGGCPRMLILKGIRQLTEVGFSSSEIETNKKALERQVAWPVIPREQSTR